MFTKEQAERVLAHAKELKIEYCKQHNLPIPSFDCEEDYIIPVENNIKTLVGEIHCPHCGARLDFCE